MITPHIRNIQDLSSNNFQGSLETLLEKSPTVLIYVPWVRKYNSKCAAVLGYLAANGPTLKTSLSRDLVLSKKEIKTSTQRLIKDKAIRELPKEPYAIKKYICNKTPQKGVGIATCEWCSCKTIYLHGHHFPKLKSEGETSIVNICPNCHMEYHYLHRRTLFEIAISIPAELAEVLI